MVSGAGAFGSTGVASFLGVRLPCIFLLMVTRSFIFCAFASDEVLNAANICVEKCFVNPVHA